MKHIKEPWILLESTAWSRSQITSEDGRHQIAFDLTESNARRIVACVNACVGMEDPKKEVEELKKDKAELLEALKGLQRCSQKNIEPHIVNSDTFESWVKARGLIKRMEAEG